MMFPGSAVLISKGKQQEQFVKELDAAVSKPLRRRLDLRNSFANRSLVTAETLDLALVSDSRLLKIFEFVSWRMI